MRNSMIKKILLSAATILLLNSCMSYNASLQEDWTEEQFFKTAQQAYDQDHLDEALFYYEVYLLRYPQNYQKGIAAEYERAYIHYKKKDYSQARAYLKGILDKYDSSPYAYLYPQAYRVLSEKVLQELEERDAIRELPFFERGRARKFGIESLEGNTEDQPS